MKATKAERLFNFSTSEVKLLILLCCYIVVFFFYTIFFAIASTYSNTDFYDYLYCELFGHDDSCVLPHQPAITSGLVIALVLNGTPPLLFLIFVTNVQDLKQMCISRVRKE